MRKLLSVLVPTALIAISVNPAFAQVDRWIAEGWRTDFTRIEVDLNEIRSIIPRDNIPAIDNPLFIPVAEEAQLVDREPVIGLIINGDARAYPLRIMMWHEIANDVVGGTPVVVTYCPLCNTAIAFEAEIDGRTLDFGTSGKLRFSDLVMYDRQTQSWWQQFSGRGLVGEYAGTMLPLVPTRLMSWGEFKSDHPDGQVLVPNDPLMRQYWRNPYTGYDTAIAPFLYDGPLPTGMAAMERVVLVRSDPLAAFTLSFIEELGEIETNGVTIRWNPGQATALGVARIEEGRLVGGVEVFRLTDGIEVPVVHDVTFAFVVNAFEPQLEIRTE
jgi:hypothetical protein